MRWATRQHVLTSQARRHSLWHHWFAWYPVAVKVDDELDHWVWFERLEENGPFSKYGGEGRWRYRHPTARSDAQQYGDEAPRFDLGQCRSRKKNRERGHVYSIFVS